MCGIAGVFFFKAEASPSPSHLLERVHDMTSRLHHRGPDGRGVWGSEYIGLGHTRLAVIDLTKHGAQPMVNTDGSAHVITYNGEIYNHVELRRTLEEKGHHFSSRCDTEVILKGYAQWGENVVDHLRGMFAFAIWDTHSQTLFLARDRLGQKPLFYMQDASRILFSSEIKALFAWPDVTRRPNLSSIHKYLTLGYTQGSETGFCDIKRLPPAHTLTIGRNRPAVLRQYWSLPTPQNHNRHPDADLKEEFNHLLAEAIEIRKVADVKVGAFLSGGVDSSTVCAYMSENGEQKLSTFSVGFAQDGFDETHSAQDVARHLKTDHHSFHMNDSLLGELARIVWHYDMPYADSSALVTYALSREIKKNVTVALSGDGADELLLGYPRYSRLQTLMDTDNLQDTLPPFPERKLSVLDAYLYSVEKFRERHKLAGYDYALLPYLDKPMSEYLSLDFDMEHGCQIGAAQLDLKTYLSDDILVKMDIASMAHGLEVRSPFLDHHLVEWIARLPQQARAYDGRAKALLKDIAAPRLPHGITERVKMGFRVPVGTWFNEKLNTYAHTLLEGEAFRERGLFRPAFITEMLDQHKSGKQGHGTRLWTLLVLEIWFQTFIDGDGRAPITEPFQTGMERMQ